MTNKDYFVHPTAIVEGNVSIGNKSSIWHHCHIRENSFIGENVSLGKGVFVDSEVGIGDGSRVQNGVSIYKGVYIQQWVFVGPNVTFTNDRLPRAGAKEWRLAETTLHDGCSIGAGSIISCDIKIGTFALIGAGSIVTYDIPPFCLSYGFPSRIISKICACGTTKLDFSERPKNYIRDCCHNLLKDEVLILADKIIHKLDKK